MAGPLEIPVYYDFASTLCYVAHRVMERMKRELEELGLGLVWRPIDLTRLTGWRRGDPVEGLRRENALRVARELDVPLHMPEHWMDSRPALAIALALEGSAREAQWRERIFSGVYGDARLLEEGDWVRSLARELEVDPEAATARRGLEAVEFRTREAAELEVTGVPTFLLGEWPLPGIQEEVTMRAVLARYAARARALH